MADDTPTPEVSNPETPAEDVISATEDVLDGVEILDIDDETPTEEDAKAAVEDGSMDHPDDSPAVAEHEGEEEAKAPETPAPVVKAPEPKVEAPAPDPQAEQRAAKAQADYAKYLADREALEKKFADESFDPVDDGALAARVAINGQKYLEAGWKALHEAQLETRETLKQRQELESQEAFWADWAKSNAEVGAAGRKLWDDAVKAAEQKGYTGEAQRAAATVMWEGKVELAKAQKKTAAPAKPAAAPVAGKPVAPKPGLPKTPPITKGGGKVAPGTASHRPPVPAKDPEDELVERIAPGIKDFAVG